MDIASQYVLDPPTLSPITFNSADIFGDGAQSNVFWLTDIKGLDVASIRNPQFLNPLAHGGYKPVPWLEEPLHPRFEGVFWTGETPLGGDCREDRNAMWHQLRAALRDCYDAPGTLSWNEPGVGDFELEVSYELKLEHGFDAGFTVMTFTFGLYSEASVPAAA